MLICQYKFLLNFQKIKKPINLIYFPILPVMKILHPQLFPNTSYWILPFDGRKALNKPPG